MVKRIIKIILICMCCLIFWAGYCLANISSVFRTLLIFVSGYILYSDIKYIFRQRSYYVQKMNVLASKWTEKYEKYREKRLERERERQLKEERKRNNDYYINNCNMNAEQIVQYLNEDKYIISVSHSYFKFGVGGTEKLINDQYNILRRKGYSYIHIYPIDKNATIEENLDPEVKESLVGLDIDTVKVGFFRAEFIHEVLQKLCEYGKTAKEYHIHHLLFFRISEVSDILEALPIPIKFYLHDYYTICKDFNLLKNGEEYCGSDGCNEIKCISCVNYSQAREFVVEIRLLLKQIASRVLYIAPSEVAKNVWGSAYPEYSDQIRVIGHLSLEGQYMGNRNKEYKEGTKIKIGYVGYQSVNKGWLEWEELCKELKETDMPYEFYHLGASSDTYDYITKIPVSFQQDGEYAMINKLRENDIDIAFLWSIWPETYSFTYFESYAANAFVVTSDISGNISVQTKKNRNGRVFSDIHQLISYLKDYERVRRDLEWYRSTGPCGPQCLIPNEEFVKLIEDDKMEEE